MTTALAEPAASSVLHLAEKAAAGKLAHLAEKPGASIDAFDNDNHTAEIKWDGWRILIHRAEDSVEIWTRSGKRHDGSLPTIEAELADNLPPGTWLDCEAVALEIDNGKVTTSSAKVGKILGSTTAKAATIEHKVTLVAFDLLAHGGIDATRLSFGKRRELLDAIFAGADWKRTMLSPQLRPTTASYDAVLAQGYEGLMVKRLDARYAPNARGKGMTKFKPELEMDVILTGWKPGENGFTGLVGAVEFGAYDADGNLVHLGRCSGMDMKTREDMTNNWAKYEGQPAEVAYLERHPTGGFRSPQFKRLRGGELTPQDCTLEKIG